MPGLTGYPPSSKAWTPDLVGGDNFGGDKFKGDIQRNFIIISCNRSRWAEKECYLLCLNRTKIDHANISNVLIASRKKTLVKMRKARGQIIQVDN